MSSINESLITEDLITTYDRREKGGERARVSDTLVSHKFSARIGKPSGINGTEECPVKKEREKEIDREEEEL